MHAVYRSTATNKSRSRRSEQVRETKVFRCREFIGSSQESFAANSLSKNRSLI